MQTSSVYNTGRTYIEVSKVPSILSSDDITVEKLCNIFKEEFTPQDIQDYQYGNTNVVVHWNHRFTLRHHAQRRIEIAYYLFVAHWKIAVRTDGSVVQVNNETKKARYQGGRSTVKGYHAAHPNSQSGLICDRFQSMQKEIKKEKKVTPQKRKILQNRGMSVATINYMEENPKAVSDLIKVFCPIPFILEGTEAELLLNCTDITDSRSNTLVDLKFEKSHRPDKIRKLFNKVMKGQMLPEIAAYHFKLLVSKHFLTSLKEINERGELLKKYQACVLKVKKIESKYRQTTHSLTENRAEKYLTLIYEIRDFRNHDLAKASKFSCGVTLAITNKYFVKVSPRPNLENLKTRYGKSYKKIVKTYWEKILPPDWNEIKTEFTKRFEKQALVASFTEDQLRGSLNTDLGMIVKVFNPFSKTWSLRTEYQTLALQKRMTHVEPHVPQIRIDRATGTARKHLKKIRKMEKKKQRQGVKRKREATKKLDFESESLSNSMETDSIEY